MNTIKKLNNGKYIKFSNKFFMILSLITLVFLAGCQSCGWDSDAVARDTFTPGVSVKTVERNWDSNNNPNETKVKNDPAYLYDSEQNIKE